MTFLLYHYASASKGVFHELQTLNYRSSDLSNSFPSYRDSISFMFERPDFEKIADLYLKRGINIPFGSGAMRSTNTSLISIGFVPERI